MKNTINTIKRTLMVSCLMGFFMPLAAQNAVTYLERSWDPEKKQVVTVQKTRTDCEVITGDDGKNWKTLEGGWHVITGTAIRKCFHCYGDVHLILADDCIMKTQHLKLEDDMGFKLHIYSQSDGDHQGKITVVNNSFDEAAAIGSSKNHDMGSIYIHGGDILAVQSTVGCGQHHGAVIGGGNKKKIGANSEFVVYGGKLNVYNTERSIGAGIGGGGYSDQGGPITIYGGLVQVYSQRASIGGGFGGNGGTVNIYGGKVIAGKYPSNFYITSGAGIGGCWHSGNHAGGAGGDVHIHGGEVYAYGSGGNAGIGGSYNKSGGSLEVTGGMVYANGAYNPDNNGKFDNAPAIGSGRYGDGINLTFTGGVIKAVTKASHGEKFAPIGSGTYYGGHPIYNNGTVKLGNMKVSYSNHQDAANDEKYQQGDYLHPVIADQRLGIFQNHANTFVQVEACTHQKTVYQIKDEKKHIRQCHYCGLSEEENHTFDANHNCVCGMTDGFSAGAMKVTIYTTTDGKTYTSEDYEVIKGLEMILPAPPTIEGLTFTGYLQNPATAPSSIEMKDSERSNNQLLAAGTAISPEKDVVYYARYRYTFTEEWIWNDKCTQAYVKLTNPLFGFMQVQGVITEDLKAHYEPTGNTPGEAHYWSTATYNKDTDLTYYFEDCHMRILPPTATVILDTKASDEENASSLAPYLGGYADITINNLTLKKDGKLHPICLPFSGDVSDSPLNGATIYQQSSWTIVDGHLDIVYQKTSKIEAGVPCFYRFPSGGTDVTHPTFDEVALNDFGGGKYCKYYEHTGTYGLYAPDDEDYPCVFVLDNDEMTLVNGYLGGFSNYFYFPVVTHTDGTRAVCTLTLEIDDKTKIHKRIAYNWAGDGSKATPYVIHTKEQLQEMCQAFNNGTIAVEGKYFLQDANITFDKNTANDFTPINSFNAYYDGAGHTISGLNIDRQSKNSALIDNMMGGCVKNVIIQNSTFKGYRTAAIAANMQGNSSIENCHVLKDVTIESGNDIAAGIAAYMNQENACVTGCTSQATVKGSLHVGGVVGRAVLGNVNNCIYLGNSVTATQGRNMAVVASFGNADDNVRDGLYYTATSLTDKHAKLMPNRNEDNTDFLTRLHERDEFLLQAPAGLTKEQIGYDITLNGRSMKAAQNADGTWQSRALSICLPFNLDLAKLPNASDISVYRLHEVDLENKVLQFTNEFPLLEAGVPYMVVLTKGEIPLSAKNVTIVATPKEPTAINSADGSKQIGWWNGTFKRIENDQFFTDNMYVAMKNKTYMCPPKGYTKAFAYPFIGYFSALAPLNFETFQTKYIYTENGEEKGEETEFPADEFESDGEVNDTDTGINTMNHEGSTLNTQQSTYYDLQGRKLNGKPSKGVYIQNGKLFVK